MKRKNDFFLTSKLVLIFVFIVALTSVVGYAIAKNITAIIVFTLIGFITTFFSKNMIVVLLMPTILTAIIVGCSGSKLEGFYDEDKEDFEDEEGRQQENFKNEEDEEKEDFEDEGGNNNQQENFKNEEEEMEKEDFENEEEKEQFGNLIDKKADKNSKTLSKDKTTDVYDSTMQRIKALKDKMKKAQNLMQMFSDNDMDNLN